MYKTDVQHHTSLIAGKSIFGVFHPQDTELEWLLVWIKEDFTN